MFICARPSAIGSASSFAHMSMYARAMPSSSVNARPLPFACRFTKSASTFDECSRDLAEDLRHVDRVGSLALRVLVAMLRLPELSSF